MFITVMSGAGCWELVNPWCSLVILITHLRQRGQVPLDATIALLAEDGHLVNLGEGLEEGPSPAPSMGSPLLQERGTYVLVQIFKCKRGAPTCYESLLEKLDERCPDLAEELRWLSGLPPRAMAGEGVPALCMATRSKALLHGPEGWASCCLGPTSWGREPVWTARGCQITPDYKVTFPTQDTS
ncbi:uncharacterized protein C22orf15 homolog [Eschrichtius robustus]|uniref:uncharacterized protein C22orf15 homolog n=1 Tax=Eschrichtius robustus TaxID=9764 RepID=UPI0035BF478C